MGIRNAKKKTASFPLTEKSGVCCIMAAGTGQGAAPQYGLDGVVRILLTGFRATGKSRVGKILADILGLTFLDTDHLLSRHLGCTLTDYVARHGWAAFRQQEEELLRGLAGEKGVVIASGGGAVLHEEAWESLRRGSVSVWLQASEETIARRLFLDSCSSRQRPSLTGMASGEEVQLVLAEREPFYRAASDFALATDDNSPRELAQAIIGELRARSQLCPASGGERVSCGVS